MWQMLERLRERPDHEKRSVALLLAGGLTLVVVLGWLITLPGRIASVGEETETLANARDAFAPIGENINLFLEEYEKLQGEEGGLLSEVSTTTEAATSTQDVATSTSTSTAPESAGFEGAEMVE